MSLPPFIAAISAPGPTRQPEVDWADARRRDANYEQPACASLDGSFEMGVTVRAWRAINDDIGHLVRARRRAGAVRVPVDHVPNGSLEGIRARYIRGIINIEQMDYELDRALAGEEALEQRRIAGRPHAGDVAPMTGSRA